MRRQNVFTQCPCGTLPPCPQPQVEVVPRQPQREQDVPSRQVPQAKASYCSSYRASCYPKQTSAQRPRTPPQAKASYCSSYHAAYYHPKQRRRTPPQQKPEEKRSSEEFLAVVSLSEPTPPRPRNRNQLLANGFHLELDDSLGVNNVATQTEKSGPSCWCKLVKKLTPSNSKRQKPSGKVSREFQTRPVAEDVSRPGYEDDEKRAKVNFFKPPEVNRQGASELQGQDPDEFQDDSSADYWNYPSMVTPHRTSNPLKSKRNSCCCICEEEDECTCRCCCHPCAPLVDANLQTCSCVQQQEKIVQTDASKRQCCKCCPCCRGARNDHLREKPKAKNAKPLFKNKLADLDRPRTFAQVNRLELFRPRNVAMSRGVCILQEYLLNTMSLDAANNAYANDVSEKQPTVFAQEHYGSRQPTKPKEPRRVAAPTRGCCVCQEVDCSCTCCLQPPLKSDVHAQTSEYFLREKSSQTPQKSKCCRCCRCCRDRGKNNCVNCLGSSAQDEHLDDFKNDYTAKTITRMVPEKDSTLMTRTHSAQCSISEAETPPPSKISDFVEGLFGKRYQVGDFRTPNSKDYLGAYWGGHKCLGGVKAFETHFTKQIERLEEKINVLACNINSGRDYSATNPGPEEEPPDNDVRFIYEGKNPNNQEEPKWVCLDHCDLTFPPYGGGGGLEEGGENQPCFEALVSESKETEKLLENIENHV